MEGLEIMKKILAWHFIRPDMKLAYGDDRLVKVGETLSVDPEKLSPCYYGLHASVKPIDALSFLSWPDAIVCRVELSGKMIENLDKICAEHRKVLWMHKSDDLLWEWACCCAEDVLHLANDPRSDAVVKARRDFQLGLIKKDELAAARDAARAAAWDAARAAARAAAWDAARAAAWDAQNTLLEDMLHDMNVFMGDEL